ncbi:MAG: PHP domain-containing protein [Bacteroidetes bacterium]|nr:PHP domain-containing protein [Bacteroidota bacterium]MBU1422935.1 PHP domain-containing protein [Bacteroidota bacterium]MBU2636223.1 PHP domain-containing protein [Bacteroidota bacterium]
MLKLFKSDLHIHTCLSPCGDLKMSPKNIIHKALENNLDMIAICDHNSAENVQAVIKAAEGKNILVIPGIEICTKEEIHVLSLFEKMESASKLQFLIYAHIFGENNPDAFGMQIIANENDEVEKFETKLLIGAADLSIEQVVDEIHKLNGVAIASHIDRESYSVIGQLGFVPDNLNFDALEISPRISFEDARKRFPEYRNYEFIQNSDAHFIDDIGKVTTEFLLAKSSFNEIKKALKNEDGRKVIE